MRTALLNLSRAVLDSEVQNMRFARPLITLAVACLLALPAFSMPWNSGPGNGGRFDQLNLTEEEMNNMTLAELRELRQESNQDQCPMNNTQEAQCPMNNAQMGQGPANNAQMNRGPVNNAQMGQGSANNAQMGRGYGDISLLMDDLTDEEIQSMTLAEFNELRAEKMSELQNMTAEEIATLREEKMAEMENMTIAELKEMRQERSDQPFVGGGACLLVADLTAEDLENMTLTEIETLRQEKIDELNNMTLAEIATLKEEKQAAMENMTIDELKDELKEQMEVCSLLGLGGFGNNKMGGQFGMAGSDGCGFNCGQAAQQNLGGMAGTAAMNQQGRGDNQINGPGIGGRR